MQISNIGINNKVEMILSFKSFIKEKTFAAVEINSRLTVWKMHLIRISSAKH